MAEQKSKLISMTFRKPWHRYAKGDRAGFEPERAKQLEERKIAVPTAKAKEDAKASSGQAGGGQKPAAKGTEGADKT
ncbi:hypothetical protein [Halomonas organivorans]|uniref:Uncharacterized protein n=1 Tax=Halomonas organivorans TaxID=257772 RepID=A0A7W5G7R7_9GAMM|nr:hypothetical protein [Halomonas organivorans]MBB3142821.1 hypothetical protein [Halomonas organivorans]